MNCVACGGSGKSSNNGRCIPCLGSGISSNRGEVKMFDLQQLFGNNGFDTGSVEPQGDFPVLPPGNYPVLIENAEVKATKKGDGHYIKLTMSVVDGPYKNRKLWDQINIQNPGQQCVEIGLRCLAALGQAIGLASINATEQLLDQVCIAHVKVKDGQNQIRTYSALTPAAVPNIPQVPLVMQPPTAQQPPQAIQQQPQQGFIPGTSAGPKPPWVK